MRAARPRYPWPAEVGEALRDQLRNMVCSANKAARRLGVPGVLTIADVATLRRICAYCGTTDDLTLDHMTPMARGGENTRDNVTLACRRCNAWKKTRTAEEFRRIAA